MRPLALALLAVVVAAPAAAKKRPRRSPLLGATGQSPPADHPVKAPREALLAAADEITRQVAALRGLGPKAPLERGVLTRAEIGKKLEERIAKEYTPEEVRGEARVLKRLGLLPPDADYQRLLIDLLMEQVAGFYDPFARKLYIADWLPLEMQRPALAHEIEHALQDQHFDLKRFAKPLKDDGDRQLARACLVEGDGTAIMLEFQAQAMGLPIEQLPALVSQLGKQMLEGGMGQTPLFEQAPPFLKQTLIFPYLGGLTFVEQLRKAGVAHPWTQLDESWRAPPESTEQVLHPEKYAAREAPLRVTPGPMAALAPQRELRRDVLGELELKILFGSAMPEPDAARAAAGWGGDRLVAWADGEGAPTIVDLSAWDSEADAKEAEAAAQKLVAKLDAADASPDAYFVERRGDRVLMAIGVPEGKRAALADEIWAGWKVSR